MLKMMLTTLIVFSFLKILKSVSNKKSCFKSKSKSERKQKVSIWPKRSLKALKTARQRSHKEVVTMSSRGRLTA